MSQSENSKKQNAFIAARLAGSQPLPPPPPRDALREFMRIVVQTPPNAQGGLTCPTSPNATSKTE